ncbi:hypothetical protein DB346_04605 [Verrucomicrobia bacterium LW23]|nr:hypothetical protein DB346_04605 [Verrucomicrobia bacterium LW23]
MLSFRRLSRSLGAAFAAGAVGIAALGALVEATGPRGAGLLVAAAVAAPAPSGMTLAKVEPSGIEDIVVEHYTASNPTGPSTKEVWLADRNNRDNRVFLFRHVRLAEVLISPDQRYLVINNAYASSASSLLLYERASGLEYRQVRDGKEMSTSITAALSKQLGSSLDKMESLYIRADKWDGPGSLQVRVSGQGGKTQLDGATVTVSVPKLEVAVANVPTRQVNASGDGGMPPAAAPSIQPGSRGTKSTTPSTAGTSPKRPASTPAPATPTAPHGTNPSGISIPPPSPTYQPAPQPATAQTQDQMEAERRRAANVPPPVTPPAPGADEFVPGNAAGGNEPTIRFHNGSTTYTWSPGGPIRRSDRYVYDRDVQPPPENYHRHSPAAYNRSRRVETYSPELDSPEGQAIYATLSAYFRTSRLDFHHLRAGGEYAFADVTPERRSREGGDGPRTQLLMRHRDDGWVLLRSSIAQMRSDDDRAYPDYLVRIMATYADAPTGLFPRDPLRRASDLMLTRMQQRGGTVGDGDGDDDRRGPAPRDLNPTTFPTPANTPGSHAYAPPPPAPAPADIKNVAPVAPPPPSPAPQVSASGTFEPAKGSDQRKAIVDGLRDSLGNILQRKCVFKVSHLRVNGKYAFIRFTPLDAETEEPAGQPGTALLRNRDGAWSVAVIENDQDGRVGDRLLGDIAASFPDVPRDLMQ